MVWQSSLIQCKQSVLPSNVLFHMREVISVPFFLLYPFFIDSCKAMAYSNMASWNPSTNMLTWNEWQRGRSSWHILLVAFQNSFYLARQNAQGTSLDTLESLACQLVKAKWHFACLHTMWRARDQGALRDKLGMRTCIMSTKGVGALQNKAWSEKSLF